MPPDKDVLFRRPYSAEIAVGLIFVAALMFRLDVATHEFAVAAGLAGMPLLRTATTLGDSAWYLIPLGIAAPLLFLAHRLHSGRRKSALYGWLACAAGFLFAAVAVAGILVNLAKIVFGRARPRLFEQLGATDFSLFTLGSDFASFPSGHANTSFAIALALAFFLPRIRWWLLAFALFIALTRVGVGSHYMSDVAAGALLAVVVVYELRWQCARRRIVFAFDGNGGIRLRAPRLRRHLAKTLRMPLKQA